MSYKKEVLKSTDKLLAMLRKAPDQRYALVITRGFLRCMFQKEVTSVLYEANVCELGFEDVVSYLTYRLSELRKEISYLTDSVQFYTGCPVRLVIEGPSVVNNAILVRSHFFSGVKFICLN